MPLILRAGTWNIAHRGRKTVEVMGDLVRSKELDVLMLQEANPRALSVFQERAGFDWVYTAYDAGAPQPAGRGGPRLAAIAGRGPEPHQLSLLEGVALPPKALTAVLPTSSGPVSVASYHAPPGVTHGIGKVRQAHALRAWIERTSGPVIVGADANTPEVDHPDISRVRTHWHTGGPRIGLNETGDDIVFGGVPTHRLRDALRLWLGENPEELAVIRQQRPEGPLAVSHRVGGGRAARRYDALWVSAELRVRAIRYEYEAAVQAGSDHALVTAALELACD